MKVGILVTIHNRPELTKQTLEDLYNSTLPDNKVILLWCDNPDHQTWEVVKKYFGYEHTLVLRTNETAGIKKSLLLSIAQLWADGCDIVTNLDNDVRLKPNWLTKLLELYKQFPGHIITGFHSLTRNRDGSERHRTMHYTHGDNYCVKESVGGINMLFNKRSYELYIKPALEMPTGNWDHEACKRASKVICAIPSLIEHTGISSSSLGHNQEEPDTAADFYDKELDLPNITLIGVDCVDQNRLREAATISSRFIDFGAIRLITNKPITSKYEYSKFIIEEIYKYVDTSHMLIIQYDGYVLNHKAWRKEFLDYDYIGATWLYKDNMNVGNGGFSLRSKRLMQIVATDPALGYRWDHTPEDVLICRTYRKYLENKYGIKFATEEIANLFSIEAYGSRVLEGANKYSGQFGFHGYNIDFSESNLTHIPTKKKWLIDRL